MLDPKTDEQAEDLWHQLGAEVMSAMKEFEVQLNLHKDKDVVCVCICFFYYCVSLLCVCVHIL